MEDTGIDFLSDLQNDDIDEKQLGELLDKIEKENSIYDPKQYTVADDPPSLAPIPVPVQNSAETSVWMRNPPPPNHSTKLHLQQFKCHHQLQHIQVNFPGIHELEL